MARGNLEEPVVDEFDADILNRIVADTGKWAYGCVMMEVWVMNQYNTHLVRAEGGWWMEPRFHMWNCTEEAMRPNERRPCSLCKLVNPNKKGFVEAAPVSAGVGLPGALWAEIHRPVHHKHKKAKNSESEHPKRRSSKDSRRQSLNQLHAYRGGLNLQDMANDLMDEMDDKLDEKKIVWRQVKPLAKDPDQPFNRRLKLIAQCGIGLAAAVPFFNDSVQGIVIYMTKDGIDEKKLRSPSNEAYLVTATDLIACTVGLREPRHEAIRTRRQEFKFALQRAKMKIGSLLRMGVDLSAETLAIPPNFEAKVEQQMHHHIATDDQQYPHPQDNRNSMAKCVSSIKNNPFVIKTSHQIKAYSKKLMGSAVNPPPPMGAPQSIFSFFGIFATLTVLTLVNKQVVGTTGAESAMVIGPYGSYMALAYGLSAAPAAQPPTAILGQLICMSIGICFSYINTNEDSTYYFPTWLQQSLAAACAITTMVRLGVNHPPAGGAVITFSSGLLGWKNMAMSIAGYSLAIVIATLINNLNTGRQYPTFWGFQYFYGKGKEKLLAIVTFFCPPKEEDDEDEYEDAMDSPPKANISSKSHFC